MIKYLKWVGLLLVTCTSGHASELLEDRSNRFAVAVPEAWTCKDEGELARSKIICYSPTGKNTYVRFLVSASPGLSQEDFANEQRGKLPALKQKIRGSTWTVSVKSFGTNSAVYLTSNVGVEVASIVENGWVYNINYSYINPSHGNRHRVEFSEMVASVVPLATTANESDFINGFVERQRRLAELYLETGEIENAQDSILTGLEKDEHDPILLELLERIGNR